MNDPGGVQACPREKERLVNRWLTLALAGVTFAAGALMLGTAKLLPDSVATHFDWNGHANGWMTRESHVLFVLAIGVALPWLVYGLVPLLARRHPRLASVRDQGYWLDPSRRDATLGRSACSRVRSRS